MIEAALTSSGQLYTTKDANDVYISIPGAKDKLFRMVNFFLSNAISSSNRINIQRNEKILQQFFCQFDVKLMMLFGRMRTEFVAGIGGEMQTADVSAIRGKKKTQQNAMPLVSDSSSRKADIFGFIFHNL